MIPHQSCPPRSKPPRRRQLLLLLPQLRRLLDPRSARLRRTPSRKMDSRLKPRVRRSRPGPRLLEAEVDLPEVVEVPSLMMVTMARAEVEAEEEVEEEVPNRMEMRSQSKLRPALTVVALTILPEIALLLRRKEMVVRDHKLPRERRSQELPHQRPAISATSRVTSPRIALKRLLMFATTATSQATLPRSAHPRLQESQGSQESRESQESQEEAMITRSQKRLRRRMKRLKRSLSASLLTIS